MLYFKTEADFEQALIESLKQHGWTGASWLNNGNPVIKNPTEDDLINNWCDILERNNSRTLNNLPLIPEEREILKQKVAAIANPYEANVFINDAICFNRLNKADEANYNKPVYLDLFDKDSICGGNSVYQIAQQPSFNRHKDRELSHDRRGDVLLLINGLPLIHIELKNSNVPIVEAFDQINKYSKEGKFKNNFFTLIQMFVAMNPDDCVYFANCESGKLNKKFTFHWADKNNKIYHKWQDITKTLLSIPLAHKMIGYYTVADTADKSLKIMRSYQCHANNEIYNRILKIWDSNDHVHGGYCYHCTGSGKTMTAYKTAERLSGISIVDKVIFLVDRADLNDQSVVEFKNFALDSDDIGDTKNTYHLYQRLQNDAEKIIVCTIQKLNHLCVDERKKYLDFCEKAKDMRCVFITDECHRSQFGDMCHNIREVFKNSTFVGFTGTPIYDENAKYGMKTSDIFGDVLSVYSIADGIRNKDVLGFDVEWVELFKQKDVAISLLKKKYECSSEEIYENHRQEYDDLVKMPKADFERDIVSNSFYEDLETKRKIVEDIIENLPAISSNRKYHGIFATSSIDEACEYYKLFRELAPDLKVTSIFTSVDKATKADETMELEILADYNKMFDQKFEMGSLPAFEKNVALRLAHKKEMKYISKDEQLDLVIVVDKLLTGYDLKYVNALYLDKELKNEALIQAFSRTNRVLDENKKHGTIRIYRRPNVMKIRLDEALELYANADKTDMFVSKLYENILAINDHVEHILTLFVDENGELNLNKLPEDKIKIKDFVETFNQLDQKLRAAKLQGFSFAVKEYVNKETGEIVVSNLDEDLYEILLARYKDVPKIPKEPNNEEINFYVNITIIEDRISIDKDYIEKYFADYLNINNSDNDQDLIAKVKQDLIASFAKLTKDEQEIASQIIDDISAGKFVIKEGYSFFDYLNEYMNIREEEKCKLIASILGIEFEVLKDLKKKADNEGNKSVSLGIDPHKSMKKLIKSDDVLDKFQKRNDIYIAYLEGDEEKLNQALSKYSK